MEADKSPNWNKPRRANVKSSMSPKALQPREQMMWFQFKG